MNNDLILKLYSRPETVFTLSEISQLLWDIPYPNLKSSASYFVKAGKLKKVARGIYAKFEYNPLELANKLYAPSYISLETVLAKGGVTFQYYETIFAVSYLTRMVTVNSTNIQYRQIKGDILTNPEGVEQKEGYFIASLERAFLDAVYIYKNYFFDNLGALDWEKINGLKKIYNNKAFEKKVESYYKDYQEDYGKH